ncbi:hypothetical protein AXG93_2139s1320 [Marchantia polymorpha subsp. ruderalis]|uniref:Uncharacterized protein n=1 Tax=Marchantia polymorpha subsp. ruderalis TaxID=1480154 RepID=A0A176WKK8_MARPO|nr:hypothetical protein AXG93_2139s1320 [Marchantia polymorpha subsp. ruderalis]
MLRIRSPPFLTSQRALLISSLGGDDDAIPPFSNGKFSGPPPSLIMETGDKRIGKTGANSSGSRISDNNLAGQETVDGLLEVGFSALAGV